MIVSPKRILWPTDFSPLSFKAAEYVRGFREIFGAELRVVHVCEPPMPPSIDFVAPFEVQATTLQSEMRAAAGAQLEMLTSEIFGRDETIGRDVLMGSPWNEVCAYARQNGVDLIVLATHGRTGLKHILLGSVAERVVRHAPCPVLVVKSLERDFTIEPATR